MYMNTEFKLITLIRFMPLQALLATALFTLPPLLKSYPRIEVR